MKCAIQRSRGPDLYYCAIDHVIVHKKGNHELRAVSETHKLKLGVNCAELYKGCDDKQIIAGRYYTRPAKLTISLTGISLYN